MGAQTYRKVAGALLFIGSAQFVLGLMLAEELYPEYRVWQTISDLGVARVSASSALVFNSSLFLQGAFAIAAAYLLQLAYKGRIVSAFFVLGGAGAISAALFPEDVIPLHLEISIVSFFASGLTPFITLKLQRPPLTYISVLLGALSFVAALLLSLNYTLGLAYGAVERLVAFPTLIWVLGFGGYLMRPETSGVP
jgi:hypothetical membrane protein